MCLPTTPSNMSYNPSTIASNRFCPPTGTNCILLVARRQTMSKAMVTMTVTKTELVNQGIESIIGSAAIETPSEAASGRMNMVQRDQPTKLGTVTYHRCAVAKRAYENPQISGWESR